MTDGNSPDINPKPEEVVDQSGEGAGPGEVLARVFSFKAKKEDKEQGDDTQIYRPMTPEKARELFQKSPREIIGETDDKDGRMLKAYDEDFTPEEREGVDNLLKVVSSMVDPNLSADQIVARARDSHLPPEAVLHILERTGHDPKTIKAVEDIIKPEESDYHEENEVEWDDKDDEQRQLHEFTNNIDRMRNLDPNSQEFKDSYKAAKDLEEPMRKFIAKPGKIRGSEFKSHRAPKIAFWTIIAIIVAYLALMRAFTGGVAGRQGQRSPYD